MTHRGRTRYNILAFNKYCLHEWLSGEPVAALLAGAAFQIGFPVFQTAQLPLLLFQSGGAFFIFFL